MNSHPNLLWTLASGRWHKVALTGVEVQPINEEATEAKATRDNS